MDQERSFLSRPTPTLETYSLKPTLRREHVLSGVASPGGQEESKSPAWPGSEGVRSAGVSSTETEVWPEVRPDDTKKCVHFVKCVHFFVVLTCSLFLVGFRSGFDSCCRMFP